MTPRAITPRTGRRLLRLLLAGLLAGGLLVAAPGPASAAASISVVNDRGTRQADTTYQTQFTVSGSGFQTVQGGFGGVYLAFGWVRDAGGGSWKPSQGGVTGTDYRYIPDSEDADNAGYLKFVAFPGSSTQSEAHAVLSASGSFEVGLAVPGPVFSSVDRDGTTHQVDCRQVTCGVITFGAHGVKNPRNETFTPVSFGDVYGEQPSAQPSSEAPAAAPTQGAAEGPSGDAPAAGEDDAPADDAASEAPAGAGEATLTTDRTTAVAGHGLAFTAAGFSPGEQVVAVLDDGVVSVGPLLAGENGEVAGVVQLPGDIAAGTHELRVTGAASGLVATERFAITSAVPVSAPTDDESSSIAPWIFVGVAGLLFALALIGLGLALVRRRRRTPPAVPAAGVPA